MKTTSFLYQLFLERTNSYSAIVLSLCLALASSPAMAQSNTGNTIELQQHSSSDSQVQDATSNFATEETDYTQGARDQIELMLFQSKKERQEIANSTFSPREITVNVVGEVVTPGTVKVKPNTPLNQVILAAGGFDTQANSDEVELVRLKPDGKVDKRNIKVDLGAEVNEKNNPVLGQNDVVVVGRSSIFFILAKDK